MARRNVQGGRRTALERTLFGAMDDKYRKRSVPSGSRVGAQETTALNPIITGVSAKNRLTSVPQNWLITNPRGCLPADIRSRRVSLHNHVTRSAQARVRFSTGDTVSRMVAARVVWDTGWRWLFISARLVLIQLRKKCQLINESSLRRFSLDVSFDLQVTTPSFDWNRYLPRRECGPVPEEISLSGSQVLIHCRRVSTPNRWWRMNNSSWFPFEPPAEFVT